MSKIDKLLDEACQVVPAPVAAQHPSRRSTLANLTRRRLPIGQEKRIWPDKEWFDCPLRFSGGWAQGDELNAPVDVVIDIGREFMMSHEGNLVPFGPGPGAHQEFTPSGLYNAAKQGWFGFKLLYDSAEEDLEAEANER